MPDNRNRYTIIYAADRQFWVHAYVSIYSMLANNRDLSFDIRVLATEPDEDFFDFAPRLHATHPDFTLDWVKVEPGMMQGMTSQVSHIQSTSTYYRLLIGEILEPELKRLLYIDCDTIIRGSIKELLDLDIDDVVLAAALEYGELSPNERLGMPPDAGYFNAGVLMINLERWRSEDIGRRCVEYIYEQGEKLLYNDQDALNAILVGRWKNFGQNWNYCVKRREFRGPKVEIMPDGYVLPENPAIAHYNGPFKPWNGGSLHRYDRDYWKYRMKTPYADRWMSARNRLALTNRVFDTRLYSVTTSFLRRSTVGHAALRRAKMLIRTTS